MLVILLFLIILFGFFFQRVFICNPLYLGEVEGRVTDIVTESPLEGIKIIRSAGTLSGFAHHPDGGSTYTQETISNAEGFFRFEKLKVCEGPLTRFTLQRVYVSPTEDFFGFDTKINRWERDPEDLIQINVELVPHVNDIALCRGDSTCIGINSFKLVALSSFNDD